MIDPPSLDTTANLARPEDFAAVAAWIGDTPETTISVHHLRRRQCRVAIVGVLTGPRAVVVQSDDTLEEPVAFGTEAGAVWQALQLLSGWTCFNVAPAIATDLASLLQQDLGTPIRALDDVYHTLERPVASIVHEQVRLLTPNDLPLLAAAPLSLQGGGFGSPGAELAEGIVAGGFVDGKLVAIAHVYAFTPTYADIGVATREDQRRRGLATAAAALVAERVQAHGRIPVWSCGGANIASLRVAAKLGFREVSRRVYLLPT
ncbi:MAG: GNAT family N-acetyltransferase [Chloroflexota bacterium]|nr:GNAT family N-acetyltransferase [Chloroflexota bacterium]